jgi:hypothetical protein
MKALFGVLILIVIIMVMAVNGNAPKPTSLPSGVASQSAPDPKQACLNTEGGKWTEAMWLGWTCVTPWRSIAWGLGGKDMVLEFEPGGRPFETTQASRDANRRTSVRLINALKVAATNRDEQILTDVNFAAVAHNEGFSQDQDEAENKLFADLKKIRVAGDEAISYDTASPLGQIIAELEKRLAETDASEAEDKAKRDAVAEAKRAAGGR